MILRYLIIITGLELCFTMNGRMMTILDMCSCILVKKNSSVSWKKYVILSLTLPYLTLPCLPSHNFLVLVYYLFLIRIIVCILDYI
jgi:hypothetical protein